MRTGVVMTPSRTASWMASGMLADDALPTRSILKYSRSALSPALLASCVTIVLFAWCGTIRSMLSSSDAATPSGSGNCWISSIIWLR